ncbi:MAG TPA: hypothetical protein VGP46_06615 [Acidimicrobiales bacterium]|nr:hypothetical protein [Acidimicrobiales bacterium]
MDTTQWYNQNLPQTLQVSQMLLYLNGITLLLFGLLSGGLALISLLFIVGEVVAAYGIAHTKKSGYRLGIFFSVVALGFLLVVFPFLLTHFSIGISYILNVMFAIALVAALLHPQSREYQKVWFD